MEFTEEDVWEIGDFAEKCYIVCLQHRDSFGYTVQPKANSCRYDQCKAGCPLTPEDED
jgi:hypothetical protein